jgi:hypothetical protein
MMRWRIMSLNSYCISILGALSISLIANASTLFVKMRALANSVDLWELSMTLPLRQSIESVSRLNLFQREMDTAAP